MAGSCAPTCKYCGLKLFRSAEMRYFICKVQPGVEHLMKTVLKIRQRFPRNPKEWPKDESPFSLATDHFRLVHFHEWTPERGLVYYVPWGHMIFRHYYRKIQASFYLMKFKDSPVLNEDTVQQGAKAAFELVAQNIYKNTLNNLARRGVCNETLLERNKEVSKFAQKSRNLFNLTQNDIYAIAPGVHGPFQEICRKRIDNVSYLSYRVLCCAFYKKKTLFDAVSGVHLFDFENQKYINKMTVPPSYGYATYRFIFGYMTFGNRIIGGNQLDSEVKLLDFKFAVR